MLPLLALACSPHPPPPPPPASSVGAELVVSGPVAARVSTAPADLAVYYVGEHKGSLETCGCAHRPRGSLPRLLSFLEASAAANPGLPGLLVHGGYWLEDAVAFDGQPRPDVPVMNRWMVQALDAAGVAAANLSYHDLPGYLALDVAPAWVVSANLEAREGARAPARSRVVELGGLRVGITGISAAGTNLALSPDHRFEHPVRPALAELRALAPQVDLLVLLAYHSPEAARQLAEAVPELDIVVDTAMHQGHFEPVRVNQALWVRSHTQGMRVGELRVVQGKEGRTELVVDRHIDLDAEVEDSATLAPLMRRAREEIAAAQQQPL